MSMNYEQFSGLNSWLESTSSSRIFAEMRNDYYFIIDSHLTNIKKVLLLINCYPSNVELICLLCSLISFPSRMERNRKCYTIRESALCKLPTAINIFVKWQSRPSKNRRDFVLAHILYLLLEIINVNYSHLRFYCLPWNAFE